MKKATVIIPKEEVIAWLEGLDLVTWEEDRNWVWITSDLAPLHKKCTCADCMERATIRKQIHDYGFIFASRGHACPSGTVSYWSHHCSSPIRFKRTGNVKKEGEDQQEQSTEQFSDEMLLAALEG